MNNDNKIAFVIPYVNGEDPIWKKAFTDAGGIYDDSILHGKTRYRDNGTCEILIESIKRFAPWADIYMVVAMPSQIPDYAEDKGIKFIYHSDFIPANIGECVFQSNAIEAFIPNMDLPEYFVWLNDDIIFTKPVSPEDFFDKDGYPKYLISFREPNNTLSDLWIISDYLMIFPECLFPKRVITLHGPTPMRMSWCKEAFDKYKSSIINQIGSIVTREGGQINQYFYSIYAYYYKKLNDDALMGISIPSKTKDFETIINNVSWVCINDVLNPKIPEYIEIARKHIYNQ